MLPVASQTSNFHRSQDRLKDLELITCLPCDLIHDVVELK
ncbi:hypothetical protein CLV88_11883 [Shimia abyssi]|uniref:Uncharacterized protein n=1 Tax=Shimia abyssi TaxID=1662395 RepID=A0A2P8F6S7_9RHOB|nr:hypothetical protein CLV88_11883 [Shimia abyssi]